VGRRSRSSRRAVPPRTSSSASGCSLRLPREGRARRCRSCSSSTRRCSPTGRPTRRPCVHRPPCAGNTRRRRATGSRCRSCGTVRSRCAARGSCGSRWPADWSAYAAGIHRLDPHRHRCGHVSRQPPSVLAIVPNTVTATHLQWKVSAGNPSWLPLPGRTFQLEPGALPLEDHTPRLHRRVGRPASLSRGPRLHDGEPRRSRRHGRDRARVAGAVRRRAQRQDPRGSRRAHPCKSRSSTRQGGGDVGNIAPCAWEALSGPLSDALSWVEARGGRDDETIDDARLRVSAGLVTPTRACQPGRSRAHRDSRHRASPSRARTPSPGFQRGECGVVPGVDDGIRRPRDPTAARADTVRANTAVAAPVADLPGCSTRSARPSPGLSW